MRRRTLLGLFSAGLAGLAGCAGGGGDGDGAASATTDDTTTAATTSATSSTVPPTSTPTSTSAGLDLREATVTAVAVTDAGNGTYRFDVTLYHDDDGEDGYANWWQVETLDGERLGRRELLHPHGTREFTRSATVDVGEVSCVVVRGHDEAHGYGGQAMLVTVGSGATEAVRQGPEKQSMAERRCP